MKYWSLLVASLYVLVLLVLFVPLVFIGLGHLMNLGDIEEMLSSWQTWLIVFLMFAAQFCLLRVPVQLAQGRPVSKRPVIITMLAAVFAMALLVFGAALSIYELFATLWDSSLLICPALGVASWVFWSFFFYRSSKRTELDTGLACLKKHLVTGSILELLIAVPTHIIARQRESCCAGLLTFVGLTAGVAVMLFAFGPAVYFLFVERWRRLHPPPPRA
ncbi:hypothetical protein BH11VER1_BH11VER1_39420 [soil metagenome]